MSQYVIIITSVLLTGLFVACEELCSTGAICLPLLQCNQYHQWRRLTNISTCGDNFSFICCPPYANGTAVPIRNSLGSDSLPTSDCGRSEVSILEIGEEASAGQFPWMTLLAYRRTSRPHKKEYLCGGTLINNRYVLTAAHCMKIPGANLPVSVRMGSHDLTHEPNCARRKVCEGSPLDVNVEKVIVHNKFKIPKLNLKNDIALVRLATIVEFTPFLQPICLQFDFVSEMKKFVVAGWTNLGHTQLPSPILLHLTIPGVNTEECNALQLETIRPIDHTQICAGGFGGYDVCRGDSGGPMMSVVLDNAGGMRTYQVGIVSFGTFPCGSRVPSVFTRLSAFRDWILSKLEP